MSPDIITKKELDMVRNTLKRSPGLKVFAKNIGVPYSTLRANLTGGAHNITIIDKCVQKAMEIRIRIRENVNRMKQL